MVDDLISRQAAIDALKNRWKKTRNYEGIGDDIAEECELYLKQLPSAEPIKPGHWILKKVYEDEYGNAQFNYICSECAAPAYEFFQPYCHRCGAQMNEVE